MATTQLPGKPQAREVRAPRLGFIRTPGVTPIIDTDVFDEQKYVEESGSDSSGVKSKRAAHEAALTRELMDGFNQARECDGVVLLGNGDQEPDFVLQVMVDSHDTPKQKPVWVWVLRDIGKNRLMPAKDEDSGLQAARSICMAVRNGH
jgi:hypothetical protein